MPLRLFLFLAALILLGLPSPACAGQATVFVYHRFGDARYPSTNIPVQIFAAQMELLHREGYSVLTLGDVVRRLQSGAELPARCAVLTVDDAYTSFLQGAMPVLRRYGYPATLFVSTDAVGHPGYLDWRQLRSLVEEGVEVGNHTASHPYLLERRKGEDVAGWRRRAEGEIGRAQQRLTDELGAPPELFAYPFGEYAPELVGLVQRFGFRAAAAQQSGVIGSGVDFFALPRFPMGGPYATLEGFREKLAMRPLPVTVVAPLTPVVGNEDPPTLVVQLAESDADLSRLRCFVQGQGDARIEAEPAEPGRYRVRAAAPLAGRRNKYTLTAPAKSGDAWYWFSQLWVKPGSPGDGS